MALDQARAHAGRGRWSGQLKCRSSRSSSSRFSAIVNGRSNAGRVNSSLSRPTPGVAREADGKEVDLRRHARDGAEPAVDEEQHRHQWQGDPTPQRQRIAIARALIREPQVLLLDEPTSALDASVQAAALKLIEALRQARGVSFVIVSHDLAVVTHLCQRMLVMQRGRTVERLPAADLAARRVQADHTRSLMQASAGFRRTNVAAPAHGV